MNETDQEFDVTITSPDEQVWAGKVVSVSSENSAGRFDVLANHANFITMIQNKEIVTRSVDGSDKKFIYKNAVLAVNGGKVNIYSDI